ncbi:MAG: adenine phosphoribosyltransferase [Verrucomicrobiales bacterium]
MSMDDSEILAAAIRDVPDFPKPGIVFKDITPILSSPGHFRRAVDALADTVSGVAIDKVIGIDARGFIFGAAVADRLGTGFIPIRKKGKLPWKTVGCAYQLEYGEAEIEMHEDAISPGERLFLVDDLLATGGTAGAAVRLIEKLGGNLVAISFLVELGFLKGREQLDTEVPVHAIIHF